MTIHQIASNENEEKSFYRVLKNKRLDKEELKEHIYADCISQLEAGSHYLVIQDTTQPNFDRNRDNISDTSGLGVIGDNKSLGFFLHPSLVIEAQSGRCIGFSDIQDWSRSSEQLNKKERKYTTLPMEQKESHRWLTSIRSTCSRLQGASMLTMIADREGDISELFDRRAEEELLIRSCDNRRISEGKLYEYLAQRPIEGRFELVVKGDSRKKRQKRTAQMELRYGEVHLTPVRLSGKSIKVVALEVKEVNPPDGESPILWRLLTTHRVDDFEKACLIIEWYAARWNIEQVFRLIKQKGLAIENSDLETGKALILVTLMALFVASKVILLHVASKEIEPQPIKKTFSIQEIACLRMICQQYEGNTERQKNNYPPDSLQWCYWVIARLGGWKPQEKQAGVITLFRGYNDFYHIFYGWQLSQKFVS